MERDVHEVTPLRLVANYIAAWNAHDADRVASLFAEDGCYGEFGQGKVMLGQEEIRRHLAATFRAVPDLAITPAGHPVCSRERVLCKWIMTGTQQGEFADVPPTGRRLEVRGATALLTRGVEIVRAASYFDVGSVVGQPGRSASDLIPNRGLLDDEDNIRYGE
jgi:steroid delta-isomerase-like uncharacterized protein